MADRKEQSKAAGSSNPSLPRQLKFVLLAAAALLIALTIYYATRSPSAPPPAAGNTAGGLTEAETVIAKVRGLLGDHQGVLPAMRHKRAAELMQAYIKSHPDDTEVRPLLADVLMTVNDLEGAEQTIDVVNRLAPGRSKPWWQKGEITRRRGRDGYMKHFRRAAAQCADATPETWSKYGQELLVSGQDQEATRWLSKAYKAKYREAATLSCLGQLAIKREDYPTACMLLEEAVKKDRNNSDLWCLLVVAQRGARRLDAAARTAEDALKIRQTGELCLQLGYVRMAQGKTDAAAAAFEQAAEFKPFRSEAAFQSAKLYYQVGRYSLALAQIDLAARNRGNDPQVAELMRQIEDKHFGPPKSPRRKAPTSP